MPSICHSERSEESHNRRKEIFHFVQDDKPKVCLYMYSIVNKRKCNSSPSVRVESQITTSTTQKVDSDISFTTFAMMLGD